MRSNQTAAGAEHLNYLHSYITIIHAIHFISKLWQIQSFFFLFDNNLPPDVHFQGNLHRHPKQTK